MRSNVFLGNSGHTANIHTHLEARYQRACLGARYMACESRLWSHTSSSLGWSIRRASGLGSCGRDGRAYLIDPPQYLATPEFFTTLSRLNVQTVMVGPCPCPMPNALCPMSNALCPMPNAQCTMPNAQCTMHNHEEGPPDYEGRPSNDKGAPRIYKGGLRDPEGGSLNHEGQPLNRDEGPANHEKMPLNHD